MHWIYQIRTIRKSNRNHYFASFFLSLCFSLCLFQQILRVSYVSKISIYLHLHHKTSNRPSVRVNYRCTRNANKNGSRMRDRDEGKKVKFSYRKCYTKEKIKIKTTWTVFHLAFCGEKMKKQKNKPSTLTNCITTLSTYIYQNYMVDRYDKKELTRRCRCCCIFSYLWVICFLQKKNDFGGKLLPKPYRNNDNTKKNHFDLVVHCTAMHCFGSHRTATLLEIDQFSVWH